jgi:hypothetical protein
MLPQKRAQALRYWLASYQCPRPYSINPLFQQMGRIKPNVDAAAARRPYFQPEKSGILACFVYNSLAPPYQPLYTARRFSTR